MAVTFISQSTAPAMTASGITGTTSVTSNVPGTWATGDRVFLVVWNKPDTANPSDPANWTRLVSKTGGSGTAGSETGPTRVTVWYRDKDAGWSTMPTVTVTGGTSCMAQSFVFRSGNGIFDVATTTANQTSNTTNWNITCVSDPGLTTSDYCFGVCGLASSFPAPDPATDGFTATGVVFGSQGEFSDPYTTAGDACGGFAFHETVSSGTPSAAPHIVATLYDVSYNSSCGTGPGVMIRLRQGTSGGSAFTQTPADTLGLSDSVSTSLFGGTTFRASAHTAYATAASITLNKPTGTVNGDVLIAAFHVEATPAPTVTPPSGWTLANSATVAAPCSWYVYYKVANAEGASWNWSWTGSVPTEGTAYAFSGQQGNSAGVNPFLSSAGYGGSAVNSTTLPSISYTAQGTGLGIWLTDSWNDSNTVTLPTGYTSRFSSNDGSSRLADREDNTTGALSSGTGSTLSTSANYVFAGVLPDVYVAPSSYTDTEADSLGLSDVVTPIKSGTTGVSWVGVGVRAQNSTATPGFPTGWAAGDLGVVFTFTNDAVGVPQAIPTISAGWDQQVTALGGAGVQGGSSGARRVTIFTRVLQAGDSAPTVTLTSPNYQQAVMCALRKGAGDTWTIAAAGGGDSTDHTNFSATCTSDPGIASGSMVVIGYHINDDLATVSAEGITNTGCTFGSLTNQFAYSFTTGNDGTADIASGACTAGSSTAAPVLTATLATAHSGSAAVLKASVAGSAFSSSPADTLGLSDSVAPVLSNTSWVYTCDTRIG